MDKNNLRNDKIGKLKKYKGGNNVKKNLAAEEKKESKETRIS